MVLSAKVADGHEAGGDSTPDGEAGFPSGHSLLIEGIEALTDCGSGQDRSYLFVWLGIRCTEVSKDAVSLELVQGALGAEELFHGELIKLVQEGGDRLRLLLFGEGCETGNVYEQQRQFGAAGGR